MNLSIWISRRMRLRAGAGGASAGAVIAVAGVALALMALELSLAVAFGFKDEIRRKLMGFDAQVTVLPMYDVTTGSAESWLELGEGLSGIIEESAPEAEIRLAIRQPAILKTDNNFHGIILHGQRMIKTAEGSEPFGFERSNIVEGEWPDFEAEHEALVVSRPVARALGLSVGSKIYSNFFIDGSVRTRRHTVKGIYESNFGEYDANVAYASPVLLRKVCGVDSVAGTRVDLRGLPPDGIEEAAERLHEALLNGTALGQLPGFYPVTSVERADAVYFNWLALLDTNVVVIFLLMLGVAAFTLISSLFILILERIPEIGILRALGADSSTLSGIFVWLALRLAGMGMILGNIIGITLILIQYHYHVLPLDPEMYYLSYVPVRLDWLGFIALNAGVAFVAWLVLILPSRMAAGIDPAKTMQYE